jgi:hypothetical protein
MGRPCWSCAWLDWPGRTWRTSGCQSIVALQPGLSQELATMLHGYRRLEIAALVGRRANFPYHEFPLPMVMVRPEEEVT